LFESCDYSEANKREMNGQKLFQKLF